MMLATFFLSAVGRLLYDGTLLNYAVNFLNGVDFGLVDLIMVYVLLKFEPRFRHENTFLIIVFVLSLMVAMFMFMRLIQYYIVLYWAALESIPLSMLMNETVLVILGAVIVCILYYINDKRNLFRYTLNFFIVANSKILSIEDMEKEEIRKLIRGWGV